jgi:hypothetical protein
MPPEILLRSLVDIRPGTAESGLVEGSSPLLSPSELDSAGQLLPAMRRYAAPTPASDRARLQANDLLLPAKGSRWTATLVRGELVNMVAAAGFFILRVEGASVLPAFLLAYLNHPLGQQQIRAQVKTSTTVPVLNKASVLTLRIPVPPLATQQLLETLGACWDQQQQLLDALRVQHERSYHQAFALGIAQAGSSS